MYLFQFGRAWVSISTGHAVNYPESGIKMKIDNIIRFFFDLIGLVKRFWKIIFIYIPLVCGIFISIYTIFIYLNWKADREAAMDKLSRYKQLIDRTEEIKSGTQFAQSEVDLAAKVVDIPTRIYDRNNEIIGEFFEQKREIVPYSQIPAWIIKGVIATEDREFYNHHGVNPMGIFRAMLVNIAHFHVVQGGSTITQQLAKVLFTDMDRSFKRKIYEFFCAREIERHYDKQDILSMYLNLIYFGNGSYGVESTSKMFFGKPVSQCNEIECSMIIAAISNPLIYSPLSNLDNSLKKTKRIIRSLVETGNISQSRADYQFTQFTKKWEIKFNIQNEAESSLIGSFIYSNYRINRAPFFNELIRQELTERFGEETVKRGGLNVYTTIDGNKQDAAVRALHNGINGQRQYHLTLAKSMKSAGKAEEERRKSENIEGAMVSIDPRSGEILAYEGGFSFSSQNFVDHVSKIRRQPGSSFKPLLYCAAFEERDITPSTRFVDEKTMFPGKYSPRNYDGGYQGNVIVHTAIVKSLNIVAVKVLQKTGYDKLFQYIQKGLDLSDDDLSKRFGKTLSLALGTYEISPLEAVSLHSLLVNGGKFIKPYGIKIVKDYNGTVVYNAEETVLNFMQMKRDEYGTIIEPQASSITMTILKDVLKEGGTGYYAAKAYKINFPSAGKTGTSTDYNDAWFIGYTSDSVSAVWIGNKKGAISLGNGRTGGAVAAPIWADYASTVYRNDKPADFTLTEDGLVLQPICIDSGLVPQQDGSCPNVASRELFYEGTEPGTYCDIHTAKNIESVTPQQKDAE
jgi:membrane carboxypeptidase/penicillin-binding protein